MTHNSLVGTSIGSLEVSSIQENRDRWTRSLAPTHQFAYALCFTTLLSFVWFSRVNTHIINEPIIAEFSLTAIELFQSWLFQNRIPFTSERLFTIREIVRWGFRALQLHDVAEKNSLELSTPTLHTYICEYPLSDTR